MRHCTQPGKTLRAVSGSSEERVVLLITMISLSAPLGAQSFRRSDSNADSSIDISDPVSMLLYLFAGEPAPSCGDAGAANDDGSIDISDPVGLLNFLYPGRQRSAGSLPGMRHRSDIRRAELRELLEIWWRALRAVHRAGEYRRLNVGHREHGLVDLRNSSDGPDTISSTTVDQDSELVADTCGSAFDAVLSVHTGCRPTTENEIGCNDDRFHARGRPQTNSRVTNLREVRWG